jgi:two-component system chemotaxis response regulator CheY
MSVLVVDDSATMRRIIASYVKTLGLGAPLEADRGDAALSTIRAGGVDLVIADCAMPGLSGVELVRALRSDKATAGIPVLMVTGLGQEEDIQAAADAGVDGYVIKPFDLPTFRERLQDVLAARGRSG